MRSKTARRHPGAGPVIVKSREAAALLLCLGAALLFPPIALIFSKAHTVLGIPLPVFYLFGIWLLLVIGAVVISRILPDTASSD